MQPFPAYVATLAVATVYYIWRGYAHALLRRQRMLRERVAFLLWVMADRIDPRNSGVVQRLNAPGA